MSAKNGISGLLMINEILSRARMREPQNIPSEASRSARQIAASARKRQARDLSSL
jgi:hypothetical protein